MNPLHVPGWCLLVSLGALGALGVGGRGAEVTRPAPQHTTPSLARDGSSGTLGQDPRAAQDAADDSAADEGAADAAPRRAYDGSVGRGIAEAAALSAAGDQDGALEVLDRLLVPDLAGRVRAWLEGHEGGLGRRALDLFDGFAAPPLRALGLDSGRVEERAEVHFARGIVLRRAEEQDDAASAYRRAVALGGAARLDAAYELGHVALVEGETWRAQIPELGGAGATQVPNPAPPQAASQPAAPSSKDGPDPLEQARKAYERALDAFVERLRLDWRDADTRANVELLRRRLRELDEIEKRREEQQQPEQDEQGDKSEQQDPQDGQQQPKDPNESQSPEDSKPEDQKPEEGDSQDPQEGEQEPEEAPEPQENGDESTEESPPGELKEIELTKEELQRLLQLMEEHQQRNEELQAALRARRRPAKQDW